MFDILLVLLSLIILFINGGAVLFFLGYLKPKEKFSKIKITIYSFALGYAVITLLSLIVAQLNLLVFPITLFVELIIPVLALCLYAYQKRINKQTKSEHPQNVNDSSASPHFTGLILLAVFALALVLRLENQVSTAYLGDMDPYYHLSFIDSIISQGTLPTRTLWGFYSYPPSFHTVFATLISTTQVDRFLFMKIVPEFLGFLAIPAGYILVREKYGEWPGIATATFLGISSIHIYRTNIAIPESIALLGMLMFFLALTTQSGSRKYLLAGIFASMVFLTNVVGTVYFLLSLSAIFIVYVFSKQRSQLIQLLKATALGLALSGIFWVPTLYHLGLDGILQGLGPSYPQAAMSFTSNTYLSWIGWGTLVFSLAGVYVCLKDFKRSVIFIAPTIVFIFLFEASNNGYSILEANLLFRGLLYLGTWAAILAGIGFWIIIKRQGIKIAALILAIVVVFTMISFPVFSHEPYPVVWENNYIDFVYRSYLTNYPEIFENPDYKVYSGDPNFNYGAFRNVILSREIPQLEQAIIGNDSYTVINLINEHNIRFLILGNGTAQDSFFDNANYAHKYFEDWHTVVFEIK